MKKLVVLLMMLSMVLTAQDNKKSGLNFGILPAIAYDADLGFRYGALTNIFHYGDGSNYPNYNHSLYLEWSKTTKGSGTATMKYDSEYLIPNIRLTGEVSYLTEKGLDFFGFNGAEAVYNSNYTDEDSDEYITRMYYKHARTLLRIKSDFQGPIMGKKLRWLAGVVHYGTEVGTVDIDELNDGKDIEDMLPDTTTLYDEYVAAGIISADEADGGSNNLIKMGLVWDTRDNEANPMSGIWTEALIVTGPSFLGNDVSFSKFVLTHRQYFTLIPSDLSFVYRIGYQTKIAGDIPFYMLPYLFDSKETRDGLGGAKNLRGIMRNRIVGDGMLFTNMEFRWKFFHGILGGQNLYLALNAFVDGGMVTSPYEYDHSTVTEVDDSFHISYGGGFRVAMNENFIVAIDYGMAADEQDGTSGLYIGLNYLF